MDRKYSLLRNGQEVQDAPNEAPAIWKGILLVKRLIMENIKYQVGSGERILFWRDRWASDMTVGAQFPDLFNCAMDKEAKVNSYMTSGLDHHFKKEF